MTADEALAIVAQACAAVLANLDTHRRVQEALAVIEKELKK